VTPIKGGRRPSHRPYNGNLPTRFGEVTFFFSAVMNYILSRLIVTRPDGSAAFNEQLGQLTLLS
jgi:hypothetical protein